MKFCSRFTCPLTSVSEVTPSHWTWTSSCFEAAHSAPILTCSQKAKPTAFGTTASRIGPFWPAPPPPPLGCRTFAWQPAVPKSAAPASPVPPSFKNSLRLTLLFVTDIRSPLFFCTALLRNRKPAAPVLIPEDGDPDHHPNDHLLVIDVHIQQYRPVADQGYQERSDQGPHDCPLSPEQTRPTDDRCGYSIQLQPYAEVRLPRGHLGGGYHAPKTGQGARDHVHHRQVATDRDAREPGGLTVGAHSVSVTPELGACEDDVPGDRDYRDHDDRYGDRADYALPQQPEGVRYPEDGLGVGGNVDHAPGDAEHAQSGNKRVEAGDGDQQPVDEPAGRPHQDAAQDGEHDRDAGLRHQHHPHHARERRHRPNREVDARGYDDQRYADGDHGGVRGLHPDVIEVVGGEEDGRGDREKDEDDDECPGGGEL